MDANDTDTTTADQMCSRRQFLARCGVVGATAASVPVASAVPDWKGGPPSASLTETTRDPAAKSLGMPGDISPDGRAAIGDVDHQLAQQKGSIEQTVDAVSDLGLDPQGNTPITQALETAAGGLSNARIVFPSDGVFRVNSRIVLNPAGPVELVGNGATLKIASGMKERVFNCPRLPGGSTIRGFVIDQTSENSGTGLRIGTNGTVEVRDVTVKGYSATEPYASSDEGVSVLTPIARTPEAVVRVANFQAIGGTAAGMHTDPNKPTSAPENSLGAPIGMWVGQSNVGTVQLVNARMRGWSNGTYSARTDGQVQILGGVLWNNSNCQARVGGGSIIDGTTMILDDRKWSMKQNPGPYTLGGNQGVNAIRVETGGEKGNQSDPVTIRNLDIRGMSMEISSSLIDFEGSAPAGTIKNCRVTNHLDVPAVLGEAPGSQGGYGAAPQTNILVDQSLFLGSSSESIVSCDDRPNSRIQRTCIKMPGASSESIDGAQIGQGVGFGKTCSTGGLSNPKKVGSGGNVSSLPAPNGSYSGSAGQRSPNQGNWVGQLAAGVAQVAALGFLFLASLFGLVLLVAKSLVSGD